MRPVRKGEKSASGLIHLFFASRLVGLIHFKLLCLCVSTHTIIATKKYRKSGERGEHLFLASCVAIQSMLEFEINGRE